ncbi:hypothetical protein NPIL_18341 [Nephila pilipes]|uniref:Uncharacterized protein n=1 Tax=Nephila pilipes TaxID=299642 RepID=A0A8X6TDR5_NEPPI|nr:hypothetical protein NPIL_18341 [Nephila pilipes]
MPFSPTILDHPFPINVDWQLNQSSSNLYEGAQGPFSANSLEERQSNLSQSLEKKKVHINPGTLIAHAKALEKATAKYPTDRVNCEVFSIP